MKILFIVPYVPTPLRVRSYNFVRCLTQRGHSVVVLAPWSDNSDLAAGTALRSSCDDVRLHRVSRVSSLMNCLGALPSKRPLQAVFSWSPELADDVLESITDVEGASAFDIIHVEHLRGAKYGLLVKDHQVNWRRPVPVVWDSVDCISHLFAQASERSASMTSRIWTNFELPRTRQFEGNLLTRFDRVLFTSRNDLREMHKLLGNGQLPAPSDVVTNGVDLGEFKPPARAESRDNHSLVVSGKMSYHANQTMVTHLVENIMPRIWSTRPDVNLWIVGADPTSALRQLGGNPRINVTGTVPHLPPYIQRATIALAPLVYGTGVQNKVLEAMACGTPVVASRAAIGNLAAIAGRDLLVAEDDEDFAAQVERLLDAPAHRREIGWAGRRYVESHHRWGDAAQKLEEAYLAALDTRNRANGSSNTH